jgi:phage I-like protein
MRHTFELAQPHDFELPTLPGVAGAAETFEVPEWVNILPMPDENDRIVSRDYRTLVVDSMEKLVKRSNAALKRQGGGGLVDLDHRTYGGFFTTGGAASGWAEEFELRDDGVYARVLWLAEGRDAIATGQYRYTSSVINGPQEWVYDDDGYPKRLDIFPQEIEGFGLTNIPALATLAIFAADEETMDKKTIEIALGKLGLPDADVARLSALPIEQLRQRLTAAPGRAMFTDESAEPDPDAADPEPPPTEEEAGDDAEPDAADPAPATSAELSKAQARIAQLEAANRKLETDGAETFVDSLVHSGKLTPAQRQDALELAKQPGGKASLSKLYKNAAPVVVNGTAPRTTAATTTPAPHGLDPLAHRLAQEGKTITEITLALAQRDKELKTR